MRDAHSFFVPDVEYCDDPAGFVDYLHAKVIEGRYCLYCDTLKQYESPEACRQHMKDRGHCHVRYELDAHFEEFEAYYNYAGSDDEIDVDGDGEEDGDDGSDGGRGGGGAIVPIGEAGAFISGRDLHLPGGKVARHKSLLRYYKQHFRAPDERASVRAVLDRLSLTYGGPAGGAPRSSRALAAAAAGRTTGMRGNQVDPRVQTYRQDHHKRIDLLVGLKFNDIRTKHIRLQMIGCG